ncbi:hypothetical protein KIN20_003281 [Parelaphostrongylus tenuis]|uniref:Uncharacterized protein n=1 Tax=Parelaphostrongylus tenuis TaxID=148309 RepID=A0AAD5M140_PARTN|nr:hypothetical protein KIN20_003281 [Parelaphostrongylus tenuis]
MRPAQRLISICQELFQVSWDNELFQVSWNNDISSSNSPTQLSGLLSVVHTGGKVSPIRCTGVDAFEKALTLTWDEITVETCTSNGGKFQQTNSDDPSPTRQSLATRHRVIQQMVRELFCSNQKDGNETTSSAYTCYSLYV